MKRRDDDDDDDARFPIQRKLIKLKKKIKRQLREFLLKVLERSRGRANDWGKLHVRSDFPKARSIPFLPFSGCTHANIKRSTDARMVCRLRCASLSQWESWDRMLSRHIVTSHH